MQLQPSSTDSTLVNGVTEINEYFDVPPGDNWQQDLNDTVASLSSYFSATGYSIVDTGQTTDGGIYITYQKGNTPPGSLASSYAQLTGVPVSVDNANSAVGNFIENLGTTLSGGSLNNPLSLGSILETVGVIGGIILLIIIFK